MAHPPEPPADPADQLRAALAHAAHLLPAQGPITVFIHHNTLHAFEHLPFDQAVRAGAETFGCEPYLSEDRYRAELARGRIRFDDLRAVLTDDLGDRAGERVADGISRLDLRLAMLEHPVWAGPAAELDWFVAESDALRKGAARRVRDGRRAADRRDPPVGDAGLTRRPGGRAGLGGRPAGPLPDGRHRDVAARHLGGRGC